MDPKSNDMEDRLALLFIVFSCGTGDAYEELIATQFVESGAMLDLDAVNSVVKNISIEVALIIYLCKSGTLTAFDLEGCMKEITDQILCLAQLIKAAKSHAGETLSPIFCDSFDQIGKCILILLKQCIEFLPFNRTPRDDVRIQLSDSAIGVIDALGLFLQSPLSNATAIKKALEDLANDIKGAVCEMEHFTGGKKKVTRKAILVGKNAVQVIEALACSAYLRDDHLPNLVNDMEKLVKICTNMRDLIYQIKNRLFPFRKRKIPEILAILNGMRYSCIEYLEYRLEGSRHMLVGDYFRICRDLEDSMHKLQSLLLPAGGRHGPWF